MPLWKVYHPVGAVGRAAWRWRSEFEVQQGVLLSPINVSISKIARDDEPNFRIVTRR
jgi:hypothetical protein